VRQWESAVTLLLNFKRTFFYKESVEAIDHFPFSQTIQSEWGIKFRFRCTFVKMCVLRGTYSPKKHNSITEARKLSRSCCSLEVPQHLLTRRSVTVVTRVTGHEPEESNPSPTALFP
jgi:hypothetical protein